LYLFDKKILYQFFNNTFFFTYSYRICVISFWGLNEKEKTLSKSHQNTLSLRSTSRVLVFKNFKI
jgi:hypothetical protein